MGACFVRVSLTGRPDRASKGHDCRTSQGSQGKCCASPGNGMTCHNCTGALIALTKNCDSVLELFT